MKEIIFRLTDKSEDAEVLVHDCIKDKDIFKSISINSLISTIKKTFPGMTKMNNYRKGMVVIDEDVIAVSPNCIVVKQQEHKEIVMYAGKAFEIIYPNSIYALKHSENKVEAINAYCYKEYKGMETQLFKHAMPNMFSDDSICMGTADRSIDPSNYKEALDRILYTQFTHTRPDNIKGFDSTSDYFTYIKNKYPYDALLDANMTLGTMVKKL